MVSTNPLIDYLQNDDTSKILYHENFSCPQLYQRLVIGADGLVMMCSNDEENEYVVGDANKQTIHEIWHGSELEKARLSHKLHNGVNDYSICAKCYLPRATELEFLEIGERQVTVENYINRSQVIGT
jgi:radical SAM protein with 4Fe4S-binding SPASM domain